MHWSFRMENVRGEILENSHYLIWNTFIFISLLMLMKHSLNKKLQGGPKVWKKSKMLTSKKTKAFEVTTVFGNEQFWKPRTSKRPCCQSCRKQVQSFSWSVALSFLHTERGLLRHLAALHKITPILLHRGQSVAAIRTWLWRAMAQLHEITNSITWSGDPVTKVKQTEMLLYRYLSKCQPIFQYFSPK